MDHPQGERPWARPYNRASFAGHETTTHLISGSVRELLRNPGLRDWLEEDWGRADLAVEEFLRFVSPVPFTKPRFVRKDVLGRVRLKKGEKIMPMLAPANLDPQANEHAKKLDLERRPNWHVRLRRRDLFLPGPSARAY